MDGKYFKELQMEFFISAKPPFIPKLYFPSPGRLHRPGRPARLPHSTTHQPAGHTGAKTATQEPGVHPRAAPSLGVTQKRPSAIKGTDQPCDPTKDHRDSQRGLPRTHTQSVRQTTSLPLPRILHKWSSQRIEVL